MPVSSAASPSADVSRCQIRYQALPVDGPARRWNKLTRHCDFLLVFYSNRSRFHDFWRYINLCVCMYVKILPTVLWSCWLGGRKGIQPVKTEQWGAGMVICLERGADLHMPQLMPLPLTVSCFSKIQIGFTLLVPAYQGSPGQRAVKRVCVCMLKSADQNWIRTRRTTTLQLAVSLCWSLSGRRTERGSNAMARNRRYPESTWHTINSSFSNTRRYSLPRPNTRSRLCICLIEHRFW